MSQKYAEIANLFEKGEKHKKYTHIHTQIYLFTHTHIQL